MKPHINPSREKVFTQGNFSTEKNALMPLNYDNTLLGNPHIPLCEANQTKAHTRAEEK